MNEFQAIERALNQGGFLYIQTKEGDIFLYDSSNKIEFPDFESMQPHLKNQFECAFEFIYDRKKYEESLGNSTFVKILKLSSIRVIQQFKKVQL